MLVHFLLQQPLIWNLSQLIFGDNKQKQELYRSLIVKKCKLLDFGCADGNTFPAFSDFEYTGLDIDPKAIAYASQKYAEYPNATFLCDDVLRNKLPKKSYDAILFACTGHHLPNELLFKIMPSLSRLLKTNGTLYYVDTIRDESRKSKLLAFLMSQDQGKFYKNEAFYTKHLELFAKDLNPIFHETKRISGTFMPQPTYYIAKFRKLS